MLYIYDTTRTPFLRMGTGFADQSSADLGTHVTKALIHRNDIDPASISETIFGCVCQPADTANIARIIALRSGIPEHVPAMTVHRNCASGMEAIITADQRLKANRGNLFIVGGVDNMTRTPFLYRESAVGKFTSLSRAKTLAQKFSALRQFRPRDFSPIISLKLGLTDPFVNMGMGDTAELLARELNISREEQDRFAVHSHRKALNAIEGLRAEITPYPVHGKNYDTDNGIRPDSSTEALSRLKPVFDRQTGSVTAGNSSQITDGAAALLVGSEEAGRKNHLTPIGILKDYSYVGCDPKRMGLGPVVAIQDLLKRCDTSIEKADIVEINEAFAVQVLACLQQLKKSNIEIPMEKLNPRGGSIALGHPVGATGARITGSVLHQLHTTNKKNAIASLCVGGGQGVALWIESRSGF